MKDKASLRKHYLKLLKEQGNEDRLRKSQSIAVQLLKLPSIEKATTIMFYASTLEEVDTLMMIQKVISLGKRVALPIVEHNQRKLIPTLISSMEEIHKGAYGIFEPHLNPGNAVALKDLDVVIVPGLAFDQKRRRLGRGEGYYDRFLSVLPETTATVGLAFDFQLTDCLPFEAHDMPLSKIISA